MKVILGILLAFTLSSLSVILLQSVGFSFKFIEFIFIPIIFYYHKRFQSLWFCKKTLLSAFFIGCLLLCLSMISHNTEPLTYFISSLRYYIFFVFGYCIFRNNDILTLKQLFFITSVVLFYDSIACLINFINVQEEVNDTITVNNINFLSASIYISLSFYFYKKKISILILLVGFALGVSFFSITRGLFLFALLSVFINVIIYSFYKVSFLIRNILLMGTLIVAGWNIYLNCEQQVRNISPAMHYRLYTKYSEEENEGDDIRKKEVMYLVDHVDEIVLPHGFPIWNVDSAIRNKNTNFLLWSVLDSSLVAMIYTFGIFTLLLALIFFIAYLKLFKNALIHKDEISFLIFPTISLVPIYLFFGYGLLSDVSIVFTLGSLLGALFKRNAEISKENQVEQIS